MSTIIILLSHPTLNKPVQLTIEEIDNLFI